jgi:membrane protein
MRDILRRAYGTHFSRGFFHYRLLSIGIITGAVVLMILSFSMQVLIVGIEQFVTRVLPSAYQAAGTVAMSRIVSGAGLFLAIYMLFYSLTPSKYRRLKCPKWPGALFTTLWWVAVTLALPPLLASLMSYDATYGSLAGVMVALFFFYLVGLGMVIGAELNAALVEVEDLGHDAIGRVDDIIVEEKKAGETE